MSRTFTQFGKFREFDKSLKCELGLIQRSHVSSWHCGSTLDSITRGDWMTGSIPFTVFSNILFLNSAILVYHL